MTHSVSVKRLTSGVGNKSYIYLALNFVVVGSQPDHDSMLYGLGIVLIYNPSGRKKCKNPILNFDLSRKVGMTTDHLQKSLSFY